MKSSKLQAPTFREAPIAIFQPEASGENLELDDWNFSGAWMLDVGA
jgi:hypothetical protein